MDKHPKSTRYGRQNPISVRWNSEEQLLVWREAWATAANRCLELAGYDSRIDHRSHADLAPVELYEARQVIRPGYEAAANEKLEQVFGEKYSPLRWMDAKQAQMRLTNDSAEEYAARQVAKQRHKPISQPVHKRNPGQER